MTERHKPFIVMHVI